MEYHFSYKEFQTLQRCSIEEFKEKVEPSRQWFVVREDCGDSYEPLELFRIMLMQKVLFVDFLPKLEYIIEYNYPFSEKLPNDGLYPLELSVSYGQSNVIELLLEKGANPNLHSGISVLKDLLYSSSYYDEGLIENITKKKNVFRTLLLHGCSLEIPITNKNIIEILRQADADYLIPIIEECEPYFTKEQKKEWESIRFSLLFHEKKNQ